MDEIDLNNWEENMKFRNFRESLFTKQEEIIINKKIKVQGKEVLLLSFVEEEECNKLYVLYKSDRVFEEKKTDDFDEEERRITNREELKESIINNDGSLNIFIKEMNMQGNILSFQGGCIGSLEYHNIEDRLAIKRYIEMGLISDEYDDVDLRNIYFGKFDQNEEEKFPIINKKENISISLTVDEQLKEELIEYPFTISIGEKEKNNKIYYNEEEFFYLDEVKKYDIWKEIYEELDNVVDGLDEDTKQEYKEQYISCTRSQCPEGNDLITISYESENDVQLKFLCKDYLESFPKYSESMAMFMNFNSEIGVNGHVKYTDELKSVPKDFDSIIEIELFSKYVKIPEEVIEFEI